MGRVAVACLLIFFACVSQASAFGTIALAGQNREHERITRHALACGVAHGLADCFQPKTISELAGREGTFGAVGAPDDPLYGLITSSAAHCDNGDFVAVPGYPQTVGSAQLVLQSCRNWMDAHMNLAVDRARALLLPDGTVDDSQMPTFINCTFLGSSANGRAKCGVLEEFGVALHASEDFYSHTNWADAVVPLGSQSPQNPEGLANTTMSSWLNLRGPQPFPIGLISGCFELMPERFFCNEGGGRAKHEFINKDKGQIDPAIGVGTTMRGAVGGNFARAVRDAIEDTRDKWLILKERIIARYGNVNGTTMICALTHDDPKNTCNPGGQRVASNSFLKFVGLGMIMLAFPFWKLFGGVLTNRGGRRGGGLRPA